MAGIVGPLPADAPIIVSNGVGIDSVALLIEFHRRNIKPSAVVTALVGRDEYGNEHRRFYQYLPVLEQWLAEAVFLPITYVWYEMKRQPNISLTPAWPGTVWPTAPCLLLVFAVIIVVV